MIEAKGGPRKHHGVPQFYLRGFTDDKKQFLVTDRPTEKVYLLSGLIRCGACGSGMQIKDRDLGRIRIHCVKSKHGGGCDHGRAYHLDRIERAVVDGLKSQIGSQKAVAYYVKVFNEEQRKQSAEAIANRAKLEVRVSDANRAVERMIDAIVAGTISKERAAVRMPELEAAFAATKAALAATAEPPKTVAMQPKVVDINTLGT